MAKNRVPVIQLEGSDFERGRQHGTQLADRIRSTVERKKIEHGHDRWLAAKVRAGRSWDKLPSIAPAVVDELRGIAKGSGCDILDVYLHSGFEFFLDPAPSGCSSIGLRRPIGALVGQNWDAPEGEEDDIRVLIHVDRQGVEKVVVTSAGMLGWVGCNRHGLAFVTNDLMLDRSEEGIPSQVARRLMLAQPDVPSTVDTLRSISHLSGRCYLIGDRFGHVSMVEISPASGISALECDRIAHTNHALSPPIQAAEDRGTLDAVYPSSEARLRAMNTAIAHLHSPNDLRAALRDRRGAPDAVCKSLSEREPTQTTFSVVFDCAERSIDILVGLPSEESYHTLRPFGPPAKVFHASIRSVDRTGDDAPHTDRHPLRSVADALRRG